MSRPRILLLGGTAEASALARRIADDGRLEGILSLAGATRAPAASPLATRIGGFGGADGLARYLGANRIDALLDATHPFATGISANARAAASAAGVPGLALLRPPWREAAGERWVRVPDMTAAAQALGDRPRRVFLTIGRKDLAPFRGTPHSYVVRSVDPPPPEDLPAGATAIAARGPFAVDDEERLLERHRIDALVTKNSGGEATAAKLAAARRRGIPVVMVDRPPALGPAVETVDEVWDWLVARHAGTAALRGV
ncbi:MAG: cobalt-precorrin-6A reductase [Defluviicoccus sp.]|nr:cobalt-precorrin-6A reductase [Defluviicoccus sp.]MDE0383179.1 cobalt-precorrin-6A reductase [Defluviicoccus sp.]